MRILFACLLLALSTGGARAQECTRVADYLFEGEGNTIIVRPVNPWGRACPDTGGMFRQDMNDGTTVRLADFCTPGVPDSGGRELAAYVDECVPAGTYLYGFGDSYACEDVCFARRAVGYWSVPAPAPGCARSPGNASPVPVAWTPWDVGDGPDICNPDWPVAGKETSSRPFGCSSAGEATPLLLVLLLARAAAQRRLGSAG